MTLLDPIIRMAGPADWRAVAALHARSWRSAYRGILSDAYLDGPVGGERQVVWRERLTGRSDPDRIVMVAEEDERLTGLACILAGHDPVWGSLIDNLHVDPDRKRRGLGRHVLLAATTRVPEEHAATPLHLTVFEANASARAAYERWGGRLVERLMQREPDGQDHAILRYAWTTPAHLLAALRDAGSGA